MLRTFILSALLAGSASALAQERMPTDAEIEAAMRHWRSVIPGVVGTAPAAPQSVPEVAMPPLAVPDGRAVGAPAPAAKEGARQEPARGYGAVPPNMLAKPEKPIDLDAILRQYQQATTVPPLEEEQFYLLASFGIPEAKLKALMRMAAEAGATVVFRGGLDESDIMMQKLSKKLLTMRVDPMPRVQVHPPLFTRFSVAAAPAWVLALNESANEDGNGCAPAGSFAKVMGDARPEYALRVIGRKANEPLRNVALARLRRLGEKP